MQSRGEQEIPGFTEQGGAGNSRAYRAEGSRKYQGLQSRGEQEIPGVTEQMRVGKIRVYRAEGSRRYQSLESTGEQEISWKKNWEFISSSGIVHLFG